VIIQRLLRMRRQQKMRLRIPLQPTSFHKLCFFFFFHLCIFSQLIFSNLLAAKPVDINSLDSDAAMGTNAEYQPKVVLVTLDGMRWQEVFYGADEQIASQHRFVPRPNQIKHLLSGNKAETLMPFFHQVIAKQGLVVGDRYQGSKMRVSNPWQVSYPGYSELLTGIADPRIHSNQAINNPNISVFEWISQQPGMKDKVAAFGSWRLFPFIFNRERSGLYINAGFESFTAFYNDKIKWLNKLQRQTPSPFTEVRQDIFTQQFAMEYLKQVKPRLLMVAFGETDDYAHLGQYNNYLEAAQRADQLIAELWQQLQQDPYYKDQTTLIITTDHGRGDNANTWSRHGISRILSSKLTSPEIRGSDEIWLAVMGPTIAARGLVKTTEPWQQRQIASTISQLLGYDFTQFQYNAAVALALNTPTTTPQLRVSP